MLPTNLHYNILVLYAQFSDHHLAAFPNTSAICLSAPQLCFFSNKVVNDQETYT